MQTQNLEVDPSKFSSFVGDWFGRSGATNQDLNAAPSTGANSPSSFLDDIGNSGEVVYSASTNIMPDSSGVGIFNIGELNITPLAVRFRMKTNYSAFGLAFDIDLFLDITENPLLSFPTVDIATKKNIFPTPVGSWQDEIYELTINESNRTYFEAVIPNAQPRLQLSFRDGSMQAALSGYQLSWFEVEVSGESLGDAFVPVSGDPFTFYTKGYDVSNSGLDFYMDGIGYSYSGLPMYTSSSDSVESGFSLFAQGSILESSGLPLYINGPSSVNSGIPFAIHGITQDNNSIPFYLVNYESTNSGIDFYLDSIGYEYGGINFAVSGYGDSISSGVPLYLWCTENPGIRKSLDFVLKPEEFDHRNTIPFYTSGPYSAEISGGLNLFLRNDNLASQGLDLFVSNEFVLESGTLPLFLQVRQGTTGAVPVEGGINLYIARDSEAVAGGLPFYIGGPFYFSSGLPFYVEGRASGIEGNFPLFMSGIGLDNRSIQFYSQGY